MNKRRYWQNHGPDDPTEYKDSAGKVSRKNQRVYRRVMAKRMRRRENRAWQREADLRAEP